LSFLIFHPFPPIYNNTSPKIPNPIIATHALPFDSPLTAAPVYCGGDPVPVAFPLPLVDVGVLVSTLSTLLRYADDSAAPLPVAFPPPLPLPLPAVEVVDVTRVVVAFTVAVEVVGVMYVVVVVRPVDTISVSVVVVVPVGEGQAGSETTEDMEPAVRVSVVSWACATTAKRARRRNFVEGIVLLIIFIRDMRGGVVFEVERLRVRAWMETRRGYLSLCRDGIMRGELWHAIISNVLQGLFQGATALMILGRKLP
jgi:hypothetical protein